MKTNGGDDWDDAPYEHNADEPYDSWSELIEDNEDWAKRKFIHHPIELKTLYFEINDYWNYIPCDRGSFSVEEINKGAIAWIITDKFCIPAGTTIEKFIEIIQENGGTIYVPMEG